MGGKEKKKEKEEKIFISFHFICRQKSHEILTYTR